jgi:hypothetical protein
MKATLEFDLPEESSQHMIAANAGELAFAIRLIDEKCRRVTKNGYEGTIDQLVQSIRYEINEVRGLLDQ